MLGNNMAVNSDQIPEQSSSYIIVRFKEPGSVLFDFVVNNVTPAQILAVASILELKGKNEYLRSEAIENERRAQMQLAVPSPKIEIARG